MLRLVLVILLVFATIAVRTQWVLWHGVAIAEQLITDEGNTGESPAPKNVQELSQAELSLWALEARQAMAKIKGKVACCQLLHFSKGFYDTPYNPPDRAVCFL